MSFIKSIYKTKTLASNGAFILICGVVLLALGYALPDIQTRNFEKQISSLNGFKTKFNDQTEVSEFYQSIKRNDGYLVLGTSESTNLKEGNYFDFLNNDQDLNSHQFSALTGAGRTCGTHIPLMQHHAEELDSLKLIYFINPVYWRQDLCELSLDYWNRYTNYHVCSSLDLTSQENKEYLTPVIEYQKRLSWFKKLLFKSEYMIRSARMNYFQKLRFHLNSEEYSTQFSFHSDYKRDYLEDPQFGKVDRQNIDTVWNISKNFTQKNWFKPINSAINHRYEELAAFIKLCQELEIQATFILGPTNDLFIEQFAPEALPEYNSTTQKIRELLKNNHVDYVDASDISKEIGAFTDHQHHSSYGAYLIYLKLKHHLYEK